MPVMVTTLVTPTLLNDHLPYYIDGESLNVICIEHNHVTRWIAPPYIDNQSKLLHSLFKQTRCMYCDDG
jgi:hypothetical protein